MNILLLFALCGHTDIQDYPIDRLDTIEINSFYDGLGNLIFQQLIFYDWYYCRYTCEYDLHVIDWKILKNQSEAPNRYNNKYELIYHDGDILRRVLVNTIVKTWTQYDPEADARKKTPREWRLELSRWKFGNYLWKEQGGSK